MKLIPKNKMTERSEAVVLSIQSELLLHNELLLVGLQVQVQPDKGRNFIIELKQKMTQAQRAMLRQGSKIIVKYDPANRKLVAECALR